MHDGTHEVIVTLAFKLLLRDFVQVVVLVHKEVVKCQRKSRGNNSCDSNSVDCVHWCAQEVADEGWTEEPGEIIFGTTMDVGVGGCYRLEVLCVIFGWTSTSVVGVVCQDSLS